MDCLASTQAETQGVLATILVLRRRKNRYHTGISASSTSSGTASYCGASAIHVGLALISGRLQRPWHPIAVFALDLTHHDAHVPCSGVPEHWEAVLSRRKAASEASSLLTVMLHFVRVA